MGIQSSKLERHSSQTSSSSSSDEEHEIVTNYSIPNDLLVDVLSYVLSSDLITNCRLVCKQWKEIIDGHGIWKLKCERENKFLPNLKLKKLPRHYYRLIYLHNPYGVNLISNSCGEESFKYWEIVHNGGDGFRVENPPNVAEPVPSEVGSSSCFATSFSINQKFQIVDLVQKGVHPEILNAPSTKIVIGEWWAARFDCGCQYKLRVILLNKNFQIEIGNFADSYVDEFSYENSEIQWVGKEWHKVSHTFESVSGTRYIYFEHMGRDSQFWAGHYGSKMTGAFVNIIA